MTDVIPSGSPEFFRRYCAKREAVQPKSDCTSQSTALGKRCARPLHYLQVVRKPRKLLVAIRLPGKKRERKAELTGTKWITCDIPPGRNIVFAPTLMSQTVGLIQ